MKTALACFPALLLAAGCGAPLPPAEEGRGALPTSVPAAAAATPFCEVPNSADVTDVRATANGAIFVTKEDGPVAQRFEGIGCNLRPDTASAPIAITELLGADDLGNVYAYPRHSRERHALSTMFPEGRPEGSIVRVDRAGRVTNLLDAGRGIWSFGVSPAGGALYYVGCDPGGIHPVRGDTMSREPSMPAPETLWNVEQSVFTDDETFWSPGHLTCPWGSPLSAECTHALVKTTPAGSITLGSTVHDLGAGLEAARLTSCGPRVCGLLPSANGVVIWNADGARTHTFRRADYTDDPAERIVALSGNAHGLYLLLRAFRGTRVVFLSAP